TMWVVFFKNLTYNTSALRISFVVVQSFRMHRIEDPAVNWLQSVTDVRQGTSDNDGHCIVEIRTPHLVFDIYMILFGSSFHLLGLSSTIRPFERMYGVQRIPFSAVRSQFPPPILRKGTVLLRRVQLEWRVSFWVGKQVAHRHSN